MSFRESNERLDPNDELQIRWAMSDAPRSPSESAKRAQKIAKEAGKSIAEAALEVADSLRELSKREEL